MTRDFTRRSRSFLYAAVAAVVARAAGLSRVRFYENGVTSLNLPVSPQLLGSLASRTTHPQTLSRYTALLSAVFESPFRVENPYQWRTKGELLDRLRSSVHATCAGCRVAASTRTRRRPPAPTAGRAPSASTGTSAGGRGDWPTRRIPPTDTGWTR